MRRKELQKCNAREQQHNNNGRVRCGGACLHHHHAGAMGRNIIGGGGGRGGGAIMWRSAWSTPRRPCRGSRGRSCTAGLCSTPAGHLWHSASCLHRAALLYWGGRGVTGVGVGEEGADGQSDLGDGEGGTPVVLEDIEADGAELSMLQW